MKNEQYTYSIPNGVSFTSKGLLGYAFGPFIKNDIDVYYVDVTSGHDFFMISKKITRIYYVLEGDGYFTIDNRRYDVSKGMLVEVPPKVEYCYSGQMKLVIFARPRWFRGNDRFTKWNKDVTGEEDTSTGSNSSWLSRLLRARIAGKSPIAAYLRLNQRLWSVLPSSFTALRPVRSYGGFLHTLVRTQGSRGQSHTTFFLRNRPQLELIQRLAERSITGEVLRVAVLGCSTGAEAYSVAWAIRSARRDVELILEAVDISEQAVTIGKGGVYSHAQSHLVDANIFERMTEAEIKEFFDRDGDRLTVKSWIKEGIRWRVGDATRADLFDILGSHDLVIANNFICHMDVSTAEKCLQNIGDLVKPGGYLFVSGVDLNIRTTVARDLGWTPMEELLDEIHDGDSCMGPLWPFHYGGLEPMNKRRQEWRLRYAAAFQLSTCAQEVDVPNEAGRLAHTPAVLS
jgi:SAM-dependent methyltransferase